jgi:RNA polymerase sigma-70 factor (ECF subfamily)
MVFAELGPGGARLVPLEANGAPAVAAFFRDAASSTWAPRGVHVLDVRGDRIAGITAFLDGALVAKFVAPDR